MDVYVICRDGDFFAVKEVSLLDQGSQAQECIQQLERVCKWKFHIHGSMIRSIYHFCHYLMEQTKVGC